VSGSGGRAGPVRIALDTSTGIVLAQVTIDAKSNEIPAFKPLLDAVMAVLGSLTGVLFVADALHTQTGHAAEVAARGAPAATGQRQPAHPVRPAQSPTLGADPGR
jgi:Transposase DDE domain